MLARRSLPISIFLLTAAAATTWLVCLAARGVTPDDPFSPWNGRWQGEFVAYDIEGNERYRLQVNQDYAPAGPDQQRAVFLNRSADGSVETVHAVNLVRDGQLICRVRTIGADGKPMGELIEHRGRHVGPGHIIWHRRIGENGFETFNEIVTGDTYWIHGVAMKNGDPSRAEIFEGRYVRVE